MQILQGFPSSDVWWVDGVISAPPKSQQRKQAVPQADFPYFEQEVPGALVSHRISLPSISLSGTATDPLHQPRCPPCLVFLPALRAGRRLCFSSINITAFIRAGSSGPTTQDLFTLKGKWEAVIGMGFEEVRKSLCGKNCK